MAGLVMERVEVVREQINLESGQEETVSVADAGEGRVRSQVTGQMVISDYYPDQGWEGFFRDETYRPQRPKARRKSRKSVSSSTGLVDRVREMVKQERGPECRQDTMVEEMTKYVVRTDEVETFQFNKERPAVDNREWGGGKSTVNRRLRNQLKMKKQ